MATISSLTATQILNSKGNPAIEVTLTLDSGVMATASCPSGTSTGKHEAVELLDNDLNYFHGKSVQKAVEHINTAISNALKGKEATSIADLDKLLIELDGSENKGHLGANAILAVSIALTKAIAYSQGKQPYQYISEMANQTPTMPKPLSNLINGGLHAGGNLDIQEFLVTPLSATTLEQGIEQVVKVNHALYELLKSKGMQLLVGDEGGLAPKLNTNAEAFQLLEQAISNAGLQNTDHIALGIDAAATNFYKDGTYTLRDRAEPLSGTDLSGIYLNFINTYHLRYLEDPFAEDDVASWSTLIEQAPQDVIVTGDDLTVTNPARLQMALDQKAIRGIIIKPNQIGTVTEAIQVVKKAKEAGLIITVSHRSGETNDDFIADFAVGVAADFAKFGAPVRGERVAKYNRLLQIESAISAKR